MFYIVLLECYWMLLLDATGCYWYCKQDNLNISGRTLGIWMASNHQRSFALLVEHVNVRMKIF